MRKIERSELKKRDLTLRDRVHRCRWCGNEGHRDISAAKNIMMMNWPGEVKALGN